MNENNIPHVVDQGASIMPHEGRIGVPGDWIMPNGARLAASLNTTESQIKTAEELFGWKWEATTEREKSK